VPRFTLGQEALPVLRIYQDAEGHWRWRILALNGRVLADSAEGYRRRRDCLNGAALSLTAFILDP
jgi:uncharacterized protein YegP (UPF0339 family)